MGYQAATPLPPQFVDASGVPISGGTVEFYLTGTTTATPIYADSIGTQIGTSVTLNARGEPQTSGGTAVNLYYNDKITYKIVRKNSGGVVVAPTTDPFTVGFGSDTALGTNPVTATGSTYARALNDRFADVVTPKNWQDLVVSGDWEPAITAAMTACPENGIVWLDGARTIGATLTVPKDNITIMGPAKLTAKAATNFEYMVYGTGRTNCKVVDVYMDANKANRTSGQNVRFMGGAFLASTECGFENCTVTGCRGYGGVVGVGLAVAGASTRCFVDNCTLKDCGDVGYEADGVFTSGTQNTITNCRAYNCLDTAFVIENSNFSVISGCTSYDCAAAAAVTLAGNDHKYGNCITGLTARNWDAPSTGGIQIGCLSGTGNLYDTSLTGITMYADLGSNYGSGAAIWVRKVATGKARGVDITGANINGASYGLRVDDGDNVTLNASTVKGTTVANAYFAAGVDHAVKGCHLQDGNYGVNAANAAEVDVFDNTFKGHSVACIAALNTSTINNFMNVYKSISGNRTTKDGGATINSIGMIAAQPVLSNILTNGVAGTLARKVEVYDRDGASQGFMYLYTT